MTTRTARLEMLVGLAALTRDAQRRYFRTRVQSDMVEAKKFERALDEMLDSLILASEKPTQSTLGLSPGLSPDGG